MNSDCTNLHGYCNNNVILHNFARSDVSEFLAWLTKM